MANDDEPDWDFYGTRLVLAGERGVLDLMAEADALEAERDVVRGLADRLATERGCRHVLGVPMPACFAVPEHPPNALAAERRGALLDAVDVVRDGIEKHARGSHPTVRRAIATVFDGIESELRRLAEESDAGR